MRKTTLFTFFLFGISCVNSQANYFFQFETPEANAKKKSYVEFQCNDNYLRFNTPGAKYASIKLLDLKNNICIFTPYDAKKPWYVLEDLDTIFKKQSKVEKTGGKSKIGGYDCEKFTFDTLYMGVKIVYTLWTTKEKVINPIYNKYIIGLFTRGMVNCDIGFLIKLEVAIYSTKDNKILNQTTSNIVNLSNKKLVDEIVPWLKEEYKEGIVCASESSWGNSTTPEYSSFGKSCPWTNELGSVYEERLRNLVLRITGKEVKRFSKVNTIGFW